MIRRFVLSGLALLAMSAMALLAHAQQIKSPQAAAGDKMKVEIRLDPSFAGGLVDLATPEPAFTGSGYVVGDSLAVIDTGAPTYVNAFTLTFLRDGEKVVGHWTSVFPATDPASGAASGLAIEFAGRRAKQRSFQER